MDLFGLIVLGIVFYIAYWAYRSGKSTGSRRGYAAGRRRSFRR